MLVCFLSTLLHTGPRVQRASGIPCSLIISRDNEMQTSGVSRRETADVYLLFDERDAL
jgi:hypothetical protein